MTSSNLILGTAFGYSTAQVRPFVESLRTYHSGDVAMVVTQRGPSDLVPYLRAHRVRPIYFESPYWMIMHVQVGRYVRYGEFLREQETQYDRVMLTDVGDVVFQGDPFAGLPDAPLLCFGEHPAKRIGQCPSNSNWVRQIYGEEVLSMLADKPISCSGTTIGSHAAVLHYIDLLLSHARPEVMIHLGDYRGHDQGIHNFLLQAGMLEGAVLVENGAFVHTLAHVPDDEILVDAEGIRVRATGRLCPVVHQYNYRRAALAHVLARYPTG